jgi:hypothetical protein
MACRRSSRARPPHSRELVFDCDAGSSEESLSDHAGEPTKRRKDEAPATESSESNVAVERFDSGTAAKATAGDSIPSACTTSRDAAPPADKTAPEVIEINDPAGEDVQSFKQAFRRKASSKAEVIKFKSKFAKAFFTSIDNSRYTCKFPESPGHQSSVSCHNSTAANLKRHVSSCHDVELSQLMTTHPFGSDAVLAAAVDAMLPKLPRQRQSSIKDYAQPQPKQTAGEIQAKLLIAMLRHSVAFSFVEDIYFKSAMQDVGIDPQHVFGNRKQISDDCLHTLYQGCLKRLTDSLRTNSVKSLSVTSDSWTHTKQSYVTLTIHYVTFDLQLRNCCLSLQTINESQTADVLRAHFQKRLDELLPEKCIIYCMVTDQGANFKAASTAFVGKDSWLPCLAHVLQLAVNSVLQGVDVAADVAAIKHMIACLEAKSINPLFLMSQKQKQQTELGFVHENDTRWTSSHDMLSRVELLWPTISEMLMGTCLDEHLAEPIPDWVLHIRGNMYDFAGRLRSLVKALFTCTVFSKSLQSSEFGAIAGVIPHLEETRSTLNELKSPIASKLSQAIADRFQFLYDQVTPATLALALHPQHTKLKCLSREVRTLVWQELKSLFDLTRDNDDSETDQDDSTSSDEDSRSDSFQGGKINFVDELKRKLRNSKQVSLQDFWKRNSLCVNMCRDLARMIFSCPPSSAESERVFSAAGYQTRKLRQNLSCTKLEEMIVVRNQFSSETIDGELIRALLK